ncbi:Arp7p SCDLUD_000116 [Saccharomycodes ludwigii]|uniref:Arp7p n=1 Tax=Saccharomycodes ludwigii TaxID=36035 RepID=UPI001E83447B|nr:hypothetical protein SCDLUD_000116 [Saccharomycodes ludwigii]KAH3902537.1 hypothetical protein SCDLUD_000116 [Saccharomycodes ludwigii]
MSLTPVINTSTGNDNTTLDTYTVISVVIHLGSYCVIAGFSNQELPQCIIPTNYTVTTEGELCFGLYELLSTANTDKLNTNKQIFNIISDNSNGDDDYKYNWKALIKLLEYIYSKHLKIDPQEIPLILTIPPHLPPLIKQKLYTTVLLELKVPCVQLIAEPLGVSLSLGRSSSLVIDIGAKNVIATSIIDGSITNICKSKIAGNFLDYQISKMVKEKLLQGTDGIINDESSFDLWKNSWTWIKDFKMMMLNIQPFPLEKATADNVNDTSGPKNNDLVTTTTTTTTNNNNNTEDNDVDMVNADETAKEDVINTNYNNFLYRNKVTLKFTDLELNQLSELLFNPKITNDPIFDTITGKYPSSTPGAVEKENIERDTVNNTNFSKVNNVVTTNIPSTANNLLQYTGLISVIQTAIKNTLSNINNEEEQGSTTANITGANITTTNTTSAAINKASGIKPEQVISSLLSNILIIGGSSLIPGLEQRIINEISLIYPQYKLSTFANPITIDRQLQSWIGGCVMGNLPQIWELGDWHYPMNENSI